MAWQTPQPDTKASVGARIKTWSKRFEDPKVAIAGVALIALTGVALIGARHWTNARATSRFCDVFDRTQPELTEHLEKSSEALEEAEWLLGSFSTLDESKASFEVSMRELEAAQEIQREQAQAAPSAIADDYTILATRHGPRARDGMPRRLSEDARYSDAVDTIEAFVEEECGLEVPPPGVG